MENNHYPYSLFKDLPSSIISSKTAFVTNTDVAGLLWSGDKIKLNFFAGTFHKDVKDVEKINDKG